MNSECAFEIGDLLLKGIRWGEGNPIKVIALHGWLDNAASFSLIGPLLRNLDIVALDLAGHGKSGYRAGAAAYNIWQDLHELIAVTELLGWKHFSLLGHSRGAMIASLCAGSFPDRIESVCLIDAVTPVTSPESQLPMQLAQSILSLQGIELRPRSYCKDHEHAALARTRGAYPLSKEASRLLASRALATDAEKGYYWRYDKRLLIASEIRLSDAQVKAFIDAFPCVAKVILAKGGFVHQSDCSWVYSHSNLDIVELDAPHHIQLSEDKNTLKRLAEIINEYFERAI